LIEPGTMDRVADSAILEQREAGIPVTQLRLMSVRARLRKLGERAQPYRGRRLRRTALDLMRFGPSP
jgi:ribosomal protein L15E